MTKENSLHLNQLVLESADYKANNCNCEQLKSDPKHLSLLDELFLNFLFYKVVGSQRAILGLNPYV